MEEYRRRQSDSAHESSVKREIIEALSEVEEQGMRVVLTLMLRQQDETQTYFSSLQGHLISLHNEIAKLQRTDDQIKQTVLNGVTDRHSSHHHWIDEQMRLDAACGLIINRHGNDGLCEHARKIVEDKKVNEKRMWKLKDALAEKLVWLGVGMVIYAALHGFPFAQFFK